MPRTLRENERYTGQYGLIHRLGLSLPPPPLCSIVGSGIRKSIMDGGQVERYPPKFDYGDDAVADLKFAMRNEPLDLLVLKRAFQAMAADSLRSWLLSEPTGKFARRAWFLYEFLTGERLDLADAPPIAYADALDDRFHLVAAGRKSRRHWINDNMLGNAEFCPVVRRTDRLARSLAVDVRGEANALVAAADPDILKRAIAFLYTKETRSTFEIENERVEPVRADRFIKALQKLRDFDVADPQAYAALQRDIIGDPRFAAGHWRRDQNFVGSIEPGYRHVIHCIFSRPGDVPSLMDGFMRMAATLPGRADPIVAAAAIAFGFVFIHPFDDGNGRIHRFLVHRVLAEAGVSPPGVLFPVSAAMMRDLRAYDDALESFSKRIMPFVPWKWAGGIIGDAITVDGDTADLYRYFDATAITEFLCDRVIETVRKDLAEELTYLRVYDAALRGVENLVDGLPRRRTALFVTLCLQNGGRLSKAKRRQFDPLSDEEIGALEIAVQKAMTAGETQEAKP